MEWIEIWKKYAEYSILVLSMAIAIVVLWRHILHLNAEAKAKDAAWLERYAVVLKSVTELVTKQTEQTHAFSNTLQAVEHTMDELVKTMDKERASHRKQHENPISEKEG